jgi:predicted RNase H-like nuclease (RuvC/YqgF family)
MVIRGEAIQILVEKSKFPPEVALGIAEAIHLSIAQADLITVPILDARLLSLRQELKADMHVLDRKFDQLRIDVGGQLADVSGHMHGLRVEIEAMKVQIESMKVNIESMKVEIEAMKTHLERTKAELMRWLFLLVLGNVAISSALGIVGNWLKQI